MTNSELIEQTATAAQPTPEQGTLYSADFEHSSDALVNIAKHLAIAQAHLSRAQSFSIAEGSEDVEEQIDLAVKACQHAATLNVTCGRVW